MKFYSTNNPGYLVSFRQAVFQSLPADKGLYMPERIPRLTSDFIDRLETLSFEEIAFQVAQSFAEDDIPAEQLRRIVEETIAFPAPVVGLVDGSYILELFHGPSLAFKDFGARFMSRVMACFAGQGDRLLDVLVATSGDTGGAVALGFAGVPNTRVTILYPKGKVSSVQELQLCTNDDNIRAIEIDGNFDDCQSLVKEAFNDDDLNNRLNLTSANSINISRLIPQTFYYFWAFQQLKKAGRENVVFSVPSGNFGNLTAGLIAQRMGLPVKHFVAATNANDVVPRYLGGEDFQPEPAKATLSNAMDVGSPSNWARIGDLFGNKREDIRKEISAWQFSDEETLEAIQHVYQESGYVCCPHTAIAWLAGQRYRAETGGSDTVVSLSTAHPCKFPDVFPSAVAKHVEIPPSVHELQRKPARKIEMDTAYSSFRNFLLS
jgi:threonine synthase